MSVAEGEWLVKRHLRRARRDAEAMLVLEAVARARRLGMELLLHRQRCTQPIAQARQLAMYLVHTLLGRDYQQTGDVFGRDRTTVSHACAHIEDLREDRHFDEAVCRLEAEIETAREQRMEPIRAAG